MNELSKEQVKRTLEQTFGEKRPLEFFNITPLYGMARRLELLRENPRWNALYAAHTVRFKNMSGREKRFLALNLVNYFGVSDDPEEYREGSRLREVLEEAKEKEEEDPYKDELVDIEGNDKFEFDASGDQ